MQWNGKLVAKFGSHGTNQDRAPGNIGLCQATGQQITDREDWHRLWLDTKIDQESCIFAGIGSGNLNTSRWDKQPVDIGPCRIGSDLAVIAWADPNHGRPASGVERCMGLVINNVSIRPGLKEGCQQSRTTGSVQGVGKGCVAVGI